MKIVICDDMLSEAKLAESLMKEKIPLEEISYEVMLPEDLLVAIEEGLDHFDMAIMDIEYHTDTFNGIDLSKLINEKMPYCQIIYLTGILEFAPDVYETKHCYFVMKNNMEVMLPRAFEKAYEIYKENQQHEILTITSENHDVHIMQREITYIERVNRKLEIHSTQGVTNCYLSIRKILPMLSGSFVRCHGGFIVNLLHVVSVNAEKITLDDGTDIYISRTYYDTFLNAYLTYHAKRI